ncbi:MAG: cupin domain-containing protein [Anaerolineae bacterium]|nr:cupin domain-containing protein [Anaerolineae bacterium]
MQKISERELTYRDGDSGVKYLFRGPKIDWGVILMLPGQTLGGHYHEQVEETFYVAEGEGVFLVNGETYIGQEGDAFRMEAQDRHDIRNESDRPLKLIFIKCPYLPQDKVNI